MAIFTKKMSFDDKILDHVVGWKESQEQKRIAAALERTVRILKGKKKQLAGRDIRIVPEILPEEKLLREIKLLAGQLEMAWESYRKSIRRDLPKVA